VAQYDAAAPVIRDYLKHKPHDFDALYLTGVVERGLGNFNDAENDLQQALAQKPDDFEVLYNLGYVLSHLGRPVEAQPLLEKALKIDPNSSKVQFLLATVHRGLGKQDQARDELSAFQKRKAEEGQQLAAVVKASQGNQDLETGDPQKAVAMYRDALAQDPNNARTYYNLALAEDRLGDIDAERQARRKEIATRQTNVKFSAALTSLSAICQGWTTWTMALSGSVHAAAPSCVNL
jgi:predicted Zn-dependent protease